MINKINLSKDFFFGGNSVFTIQSEKSGEWRTFKIRKLKTVGFKSNAPVYFVSILSGPDNENSFSYIGVVDPIYGNFRLTKKSKRTEQSPDVILFRWFMKHLFGDGFLPNALVNHAGKCGCCGRTLTVPKSILSGIGPECAKKFL